MALGASSSARLQFNSFVKAAAPAATGITATSVFPGDQGIGGVTVNRKIVALVLAGACALVAGVAVAMYAGRADARAVVGQEPVTVWVATKDIPRGTTLGDARDGMLAQDKVPARAAPSQAIKALGTDDLLATADIAAGEILMSGRFSKEKLGPETLSIPSGHLAVSVQLSDQERVASFVRPGDDVSVFFAPKSGGVAYVLLTRVQVLGTGLTSEEGVVKAEKKDKDVSTKVVTLSVTPAESARLVAAGPGSGRLHLGLLPAKTTVPDDTLGSVLPAQFQSLLPKMLDKLQSQLAAEVAR